MDTYNDEIRLGISPELPVHRRQASPGNHAIGRILDQSNAEDGINGALADGIGQKRRVAHGVPRRLLANVAIVRAGDGRIRKPQDADGDVVAVPVRVVGEPDLLLGHGHAAARDVAVAHGPRDVLAGAVLEVEVQLVDLAVAEAINVRRREAARSLVVRIARAVRALEARLGRPRIGAARVQEQPDGDAVPAALNGILGGRSGKGRDVLERLLDGARGAAAAATKAAERRDARVLLAWPGLDALEVREVHRGAVVGRLLDGLGSLKSEAVHRRCKVPVWSMASDLGEVGTRCRDDDTGQKTEGQL